MCDGYLGVFFLYKYIMKQIPLTQGKFALVDDEDFEELNKHKWYAQKDGNTFYANRKVGIGQGKEKVDIMHRIILGVTDSKIKVDHIDHNGLNNQRQNLRIATSAQNAMNKKSSKNTSSKYKGVTYRRLNKWEASIYLFKKYKYIGIFSTEIEAAKAYDEMAKLHFGEFACLNFKD